MEHHRGHPPLVVLAGAVNIEKLQPRPEVRGACQPRPRCQGPQVELLLALAVGVRGLDASPPRLGGRSEYPCSPPPYVAALDAYTIGQAKLGGTAARFLGCIRKVQVGRICRGLLLGGVGPGTQVERRTALAPSLALQPFWEKSRRSHACSTGAVGVVPRLVRSGAIQSRPPRRGH